MINNRTLLQGDALHKLKELESNSIDLIATDPPYGYSFMNKEWDKAIIGVDIWRECLRILKPGAFAFVMSAPRQDVLSHMIVNLGDAGFKTDFTSMYWAYACLSDDTEILTPHGWEHLYNTKKYINTKILIYDVENGCFEWKKPEKWNCYRISEQMYRIKSKHTDQLVSKNHRVLTQKGFICAEKLQEQENVAYMPMLPEGILDIPITTIQERKKKYGNFLFHKLQTKNKHTQISTQKWQTHPSNVRRTKTETTREYDGFKELGLERRCDIFQNSWKLCRDKIYQMSKKIYSHGTKGWLCYGTSFDSCQISKESSFENRDSTSYRSQSQEQQIKQFNVVCIQQGAQTLRTWPQYQTTLATVTREYYNGLIFCPTVSTGCFVARRKGKIFLTGNSGFPKASNISKLIDKRNGRDSQSYKDLGKYLKSSRLTLKFSQSEISKYFPSKTGGLTGCVSNWESGVNVPTKSQWIILKEKLFLNDLFDNLIEREEAQREIIGKNKNERLNNHKFFNTNQKNEKFNETISSTNTAKKLDGSYAGFQPKPAIEVILVVMKSLDEKNYTEQAMSNRKGITWLDDCRIPYNSNNDKKSAIPQGKLTNDKWLLDEKKQGRHEWANKEDYQLKGRFPANLLVSDDALNNGFDKGTKPHPIKSNIEKYDVWGNITKKLGEIVNYGDSGSFSRYFDLDMWEAQFIITPKASKSEKNKGLDVFLENSDKYSEKFPTKKKFSTINDGRKTPNDTAFQRGKTLRQNTHPTVKPVTLFKYLITVGSRENDLVLDPFMGSGTTAIAAEQLSRKWIGIEKNPEYVKIFKDRLADYRKQNKMEAFNV